MGDRQPRYLAATMFASLLLASPLSAQAGLGHVEDATTPPRGLLRLRAITVWTRYDARFSPTGVEPLGADLTADALGVAKLPELNAIESRVQSASGAPFTLTLGRSRLDAAGREEIVPLAFEYGLTNRLAIGVTVPIVRKRVAAVFQLDTTGSAANVGPNPHRTSTTASQNNALVQSQFATAAAQLQARLTACQANQSGAGCAAILADAPLLLQSSQGFAADVAALYGTTGGLGEAFVPMSSSAAQAAIAFRVTDFNGRYFNLLGTNLIQAIPTAAGGPAGSSQFQDYLTADLGRDSINTQERVGIGDVEVGFKLRAIDVRRTAPRLLRAQLAIAGNVRLPTGSRQSPSDLVDMQLGSGDVLLESRILLDLQAGRVGLLAAGQFAARAFDRDTSASIPRSRPNGRWVDVQIAPRFHLSAPLAIHAAYSIRYTESTGDQLVGGGVSYSTLPTYTGSGSLPMEMRFTHLEAVKGEGHRPKFFRDQLELRLYFRLR